MLFMERVRHICFGGTAEYIDHVSRLSACNSENVDCLLKCQHIAGGLRVATIAHFVLLFMILDGKFPPICSECNTAKSLVMCNTNQREM